MPILIPTVVRGTLWTRLLSFVMSLTVLLLAIAPVAATSISTDLWVYQQGDTVNVTGDGFDVSENVELVTTDPYGVEVDRGTVLSDANGNIAYSFVLNSDVPGIYDLVATGLSSGLSASTQFDPPSTIIITFPTAITYSTSTWNAGCSTAGGDICGTAQTGAGNLTKVEFSLRQGAGNYWNGSGFSSVSEVKITLFSGSTTALTNWSTPFPGSNFPADGSYSLAIYTTQSSSPAANSSVRTFTIDTTGPVPTVAPKSGQADPTNSLPIEFDVNFNESISLDSQFTSADISFAGSTAGTGGASVAITELGGSSNDKYRVSVGAVTGVGTVVVSVVDDAVTDGLGNLSSPSGTASVVYDATGPTVTVNQAAGQADPATGLPIKFTAVFNEPLQNDLLNTNVTLGGSADRSAAAVTITEQAPNNNTVYEISVANLLSFGTLTASIPAGQRRDTVGNFNQASTSTDNTVTYAPADSDGPTISITTSAIADPSGWYNASIGSSGIDVDVSATDGSGVAVFDCTVDGGAASAFVAAGDSIHFDDGAHSVSCYAEDTLGNSTTSATFDFDVDQTNPTVDISHGANGAGWNNTDPVNETISASDGSGSGVSSVDCLDGLAVLAVTGSYSASVAGEGIHSLSCTATDAAGNTSDPDLDTVKIDLTDPIITYVSQTPANGDGWNNEAVTVNWSCSDALSGAVDASVSDTLSSEGANQTATGTCYDNADNSASDDVENIDIDLTNPTITWNSLIEDGDSFYFGFVPAAPTCDAVDALSGPDGCAVTGYGTTVGSHSLLATAYDKADNSATDTRDYTVLAWTLKGFYQPVDMGTLAIPIYNTVKGGSTVPLKFEVFAGSTELTNTSVVDNFVVQSITCSGTLLVDDIELVTTGGTSLRYDSTSGQFIQNWKTPKALGCYSVIMTTQDGSTIVAMFKIK